MSDEELPSIFGSMSAMKAVVPKSAGPKAGEVRADARLEEHLGDGLAGYWWRGDLRGDEVAVHILGRGVSADGRAKFRAAVDGLIAALRGPDRSSTEGLLVPRSIAADRSAFTTDFRGSRTLLDLPSGDADMEARLASLAYLAQSLEGLHTRELAHGALSPGRVLFSDAGRTHVCGANGINLLVGTPGDSADPVNFHSYASPEAKADETVDARSDIFSLGKLLHFLVAGEHPTEPDADLPKLESLSAQPAGLVRIIRRCTRDKPSDRYQTIDAFLDDLVRWDRHERVGVPHPEVDEVASPAGAAATLAERFERRHHPSPAEQAREAATEPLSDVIERRQPRASSKKSSPPDDAAERRGASSTGASGKRMNARIVLAGVGTVLVLSAIVVSFVGGPFGVMTGPILALAGVGITALGLLSKGVE